MTKLDSHAISIKASLYENQEKKVEGFGIELTDIHGNQIRVIYEEDKPDEIKALRKLRDSIIEFLDERNPYK